MKHLLYSKDLSQDEILSIFERADGYLAAESVKDAEGKILATLFYEPSTRTRFSFEAAMQRLGGDVISNSHMDYTSSAKKGESLADTGKVISQMADVIVMRHPEVGSVEELAGGAEVPVVNAGDGPGDHPTQGLLDLFTIKKELGRLEDFTIGLVGDLKNSRVPHAQVELLKKFTGVKFVFVSPEGLKIPGELKEGLDFVEVEDLGEVIGDLDVLSVNRIQEERFGSKEEYEKYKGSYVIGEEIMKKAGENMILMHPLPRVDEIEVAVDEDPRAKYFGQVKNGVAVRMGILAELLGL
jgi:aspartate carbamoyltransferase catalytic subunit